MAGSDPEDELKAAIVLSFLRYADWPPVPAGADTALTIGVFGRSAITQTLRRVLEGKSVASRAIKVLEIRPTEDSRACQALYVAAAKPDEIRRALAGVGARALTIGESERFLDLGGAVNLLIIDGHMSFEVSIETLQRSGVTISSTLLRFGQTRDPRKGKP